jgi:hypothetical protein
VLLEAPALWRLALLVSPCVLYGLDALPVVLDLERARLLAGSSYDLTNRGDHKLRVLPLDEVAAVRIGDVLGVEMRSEKILSLPPRRARRLRIRARDKFEALI